MLYENKEGKNTDKQTLGKSRATDLLKESAKEYTSKILQNTERWWSSSNSQDLRTKTDKHVGKIRTLPG